MKWTCMTKQVIIEFNGSVIIIAYFKLQSHFDGLQLISIKFKPTFAFLKVTTQIKANPI